MPGFDAAKYPGVRLHESCYIDDPCTIQPGTSIWHFTHVMQNCTIGEGCNLGQNVVVSPNVTIGNHCKIQNNVSLYTGVELEDYVFCGPSMVFTNVLNPRCEISRRDEYKSTLIKYGSSLGANCTIVCGTTIGRHALIAAGAVVTKDVPDYALMAGVPARRVGWISRAGHTLPEGGDRNQITCPVSGDVYREEADRLIPVREALDA